MTERLVAIPDVARLSARVLRVLGSNPGKFTLQGTNTYLVTRPIPPSVTNGDSTPSTAPIPSILIDTGEGVDGYTVTLEEVLTGKHPDSGPHPFHLTDIILTHWHPDHVGGLPSVLSLLSRLRSQSPSSPSSSTSPPLPPRLHKFPDALNDAKLLESLSTLPQGSFTPYKGEDQPFHPLADGDVLKVAALSTDEGTSSSTLRIVHTPGHTADHICLLLEEERALFTADHVLGQGTTVFEDLGAYMSSLLKCTQLLETEVGPSRESVASKEAEEASVRAPSASERQGAEGDENRLYPAHGPILEKGRTTMRAYRSHRLEREEQILQLLARPPPRSDGDGDAEEKADAGGASQHGKSEESTAQAQAQGGEGNQGWTIRSLVAELYSSYPEHLWPAAARGLFLALVKLASPDAEVAKGAEELGGSRKGDGQGRRVACFLPPEPEGEGGEGGKRVWDVKGLMPKKERAWLGVVELRWNLVEQTSSSNTTATTMTGRSKEEGEGGEKSENQRL